MDYELSWREEGRDGGREGGRQAGKEGVGYMEGQRSYKKASNYTGRSPITTNGD